MRPVDNVTRNRSATVAGLHGLSRCRGWCEKERGELSVSHRWRARTFSPHKLPFTRLRRINRQNTGADAHAHFPACKPAAKTRDMPLDFRALPSLIRPLFFDK
ncbi:hypothetical protein OH491_26685 [Termitidicoccus mucosus]|uniref:hypothetical protein n=1 Tax=Termitidicoccus mucosus TaxID=1184151 RepID=UPI0011E0517F